MFIWNGINVDPYKVLEVAHDVTEEELKKKYRALARKFHTDGGNENQRQQDAIRLINLSRDQVLKDIQLRDKEAEERALKEEDYSSLDLEGLKKVIITKFSNYITECQVAKVTCEIHQVKILEKVKEFFDQGIAVANNCIALANLSTSREEVLKLLEIFDTKKGKFDENFFGNLEELLQKSLFFIYSSLEVQTVLRLIKERAKGISAQEWFRDNADAFITVVRFDEELVKSLDSVIEEFKSDELYPYMVDIIEKKSYQILVEVNDGLAISHRSYKIFEEEDFLGAFRLEIQKVIDEYHATIERRKNKIKYFKFANNMSDDMVKILDDAIYDETTFDSLVDTLEMKMFNNRVAASREVKKEYTY